MCDHKWCVIVTAKFRHDRNLLPNYMGGKQSWSYRVCRLCGSINYQLYHENVVKRGWSELSPESTIGTIAGLSEFIGRAAERAKRETHDNHKRT